jgi:hypothetical protein
MSRKDTSSQVKENEREGAEKCWCRICKDKQHKAVEFPLPPRFPLQLHYPALFRHENTSLCSERFLSVTGPFVNHPLTSLIARWCLLLLLLLLLRLTGRQHEPRRKHGHAGHIGKVETKARDRRWHADRVGIQVRVQLVQIVVIIAAAGHCRCVAALMMALAITIPVVVAVAESITAAIATI